MTLLQLRKRCMKTGRLLLLVGLVTSLVSIALCSTFLLATGILLLFAAGYTMAFAEVGALL